MKKNRINTKTGGVSVKESAFGAGKYGGPREDRTPNPLIKSQLLCQLSYRPEELIAGIS